MKTFYTERDIEDMHASGVTSLAVNDDVVLTDLARDRALALGISLLSGNGSAPTQVVEKVPLPGDDIVALVKARVIARLGTEEHNALLDQIIPQVLARLSGDTAPAKPDQKGY